MSQKVRFYFLINRPKLNRLVVMKQLFILITLLSISSIISQAQLTNSQKDSLVRVYTAKAKKYMIKSSYVKNYYRINRKGISLYSSYYNRKYDRPETILKWEELTTYRRTVKYGSRKEQYRLYRNKRRNSYDSLLVDSLKRLEFNEYMSIDNSRQDSKLLDGVRIAIDPGHIAGDFEMAMAESRGVNITHPKHGKLNFFEGELTLSTAELLKKKLEEQGATVLLSRTKPNQSASGKTFSEWYVTDLRRLLRKKGMSYAKIKSFLKYTSKSYIYRNYFLEYDLRARENKINAFKPDLTIVIHFNADAKNMHWNRVTHRNYNMVFTQGAFMRSELKKRIERFDFLRILVMDDVVKSEALCKNIAQQFNDYLEVPYVTDQTSPSYLTASGVFLDSGVYARNLRLCRTIQSPICYGESCLQDNELEAIALAKNDYKNGVICPRIQQTAEAYYRGIYNYVMMQKQQQIQEMLMSIKAVKF